MVLREEALGLQVINAPTTRALDMQLNIVASGKFSAAMTASDIVVHFLQALTGVKKPYRLAALLIKGSSLGLTCRVSLRVS